MTIIIPSYKKEEMKQGIYSITFKNNKRYIGLSSNVASRCYRHEVAARQGDKLPVHRAMRKHEYFFELLEDCSEMSRAELQEREKYWIKYYNTYENKDNGYNLTPGGEGASEGIANLSAKLNKETLEQVYDKLINQPEKYIYEIAKEYNISSEAISQINCGKRYYNPSLSYPLREPPPPKVAPGVSHHRSSFTEKTFSELIEDLKDMQLTFDELGEKYGVCYTTISLINNGKRYYDPSLSYPIRKNPCKKKIKKLMMIHYQKYIL